MTTQKYRIMINEVESRVGKASLFFYIEQLLLNENTLSNVKSCIELHKIHRHAPFDFTNYDLFSYCCVEIKDKYDDFANAIINQNVKPIVLLRKNIFESYLSLQIAFRTNIWNISNDLNLKEKISDKIIFNADDYIKYVTNVNECLTLYLNTFTKYKINHLIITYEDLYENGHDKKLECINMILKFCGYDEIAELKIYPNVRFTDTVIKKIYDDIMIFPNNINEIIKENNVFAIYNTQLVMFN